MSLRYRSKLSFLTFVQVTDAKIGESEAICIISLFVSTVLHSKLLKLKS